MTEHRPAKPLHFCPDCRNQFVQPFVCVTCGAQKLYDATVKSQADTIERLREALETIAGTTDGTDCNEVARAALEAK